MQLVDLTKDFAMGFPQFRPAPRPGSTENAANDDTITTAPVIEPGTAPVKDGEDATENDPEKPPIDLPTENAQRGVQHVEAVALTWTKKGLAAIFAK